MYEDDGSIFPIRYEVVVMITVRYDEIFTFEHIYEAYKKCCKGRMYKADKIRFEQNISYHLTALYERLHNRTYKLTSYRTFTIKEPKVRHIHRIAFEDKIVQRLLCDYALNDYVVRHSIYDSCAIIKGKGLTFAYGRIKHHLRSHYEVHGNKGYILKMDISNYYASVDQERLIHYWKKHIFDDDLYQLIVHIIQSYPTGIPMGNQCSQVFANIYLDPLDHYIKEDWRIKHYVRYMDDGYMIHESKQYLKNVRNNTETFLKKYHLTLNKNKTKIYPIKQGCVFLGWHFRMDEKGHIHQRLKQKTKRKTKKKLKQLKYEKRFGRIPTKKYANKIRGTMQYLKQGETSGYRRQLMKEQTKR